MPRLTNDLPAYALHSSGQAKMKYQGRVIYLGRYGSKESRRRYEEELDKIRQVRQTKRTAGEDHEVLTVGRLALRYQDHARTYYRRPDGTQTGESETIRCCLRFLCDRFAELPADQLGPRKLAEVQADMIEQDRARQYINKAMGIIRRCFKWAVSQELVPPSVYQALLTLPPLMAGRTRAREKPPVQPATDAQIDATLPYLSKTCRDVIAIMRVTAARPGEVLCMTADQIDRSRTPWKYTPSAHKTSYRGRRRTINLFETAQAIILPRILKSKPGERLFKINRTTLRDMIRRACDKHGIQPWHPNMIRHKVGTETRARDGLEAAQCLLGHSRADVTQLYAERNDRLAEEVARKIG
jgi:hypothetical protein